MALVVNTCTTKPVDVESHKKHELPVLEEERSDNSGSTEDSVEIEDRIPSIELDDGIIDVQRDGRTHPLTMIFDMFSMCSSPKHTVETEHQVCVEEQFEESIDLLYLSQPPLFGLYDIAEKDETQSDDFSDSWGSHTLRKLGRISSDSAASTAASMFERYNLLPDFAVEKMKKKHRLYEIRRQAYEAAFGDEIID